MNNDKIFNQVNNALNENEKEQKRQIYTTLYQMQYDDIMKRKLEDEDYINLSDEEKEEFQKELMDSLLEKVEDRVRRDFNQTSEKLEQSEVLKQEEFEYKNNNNNKYTWEYALEQIEKINNDTQYIHESLKTIENIIGESIDGTGASRASATGNIINSREETNRELIKFYTKMYNDLKPNKSTNPIKDSIQQMIADKLMNIDMDCLNDPDEFINKLLNFVKEI